MALVLQNMRAGPRSLGKGELTLNPLSFSPLWFEPRSGHIWESHVLLTDGQVAFPRVLRFSPTFDERLARYKCNTLERAVNQKICLVMIL